MFERAKFCYKVMSFGLKNFGTTYEHLMNKVFKELIGDIMEVCVDDMVVKLAKVRKHNMHINLK